MGVVLKRFGAYGRVTLTGTGGLTLQWPALLTALFPNKKVANVHKLSVNLRSKPVVMPLVMHRHFPPCGEVEAMKYRQHSKCLHVIFTIYEVT